MLLLLYLLCDSGRQGFSDFMISEVNVKQSHLRGVLEKLFLDHFYNSAVTDSDPNANTITGWQKNFITLIVDEK